MEPRMSQIFDEWETRRALRPQNPTHVKSGLPPIPVQGEIDRMTEARLRAKKEHDDFVLGSPLRDRVREKHLACERRLRDNPTWRPRGVLGGGLAFELKVSRIMERLWRRREREHEGPGVRPVS